MTEKEGENQRLNVASIHIRVTHDHDFVVAKLGQIQGPFILLCAHRHAEGSVDVLDFLVVENLVLHRLLHVEDFSPQRHDGLEHTVSTLLGGSTRRVSLDQEELTKGGVFFRTVCQFSRQSAAAHDGLALHHFTGFPGRMTRLRRQNHLLNDGLGIVWMFLEIGLQHFADRLAHRGTDFGVAQFGLGLTLKLWFCDLDAHNSRQTFAEIVSADVKFELVQHAASLSILLQGVGQSPAEAGEVGASFVRVDVVDVGEEVF